MIWNFVLLAFIVGVIYVAVKHNKKLKAPKAPVEVTPGTGGSGGGGSSNNEHANQQIQ